MNLLPPSREGLVPLTRKGGAKVLIFFDNITNFWIFFGNDVEFDTKVIE